MTTEINTDWENIPHTNPNAKVKSHRRAVDTLAIRLKSASIRNAKVSGVFEVADIPQPFSVFNGVLRVEVKCHWYKRKPSSTWTHLQLIDSWELIRNYSGDVVDNIE